MSDKKPKLNGTNVSLFFETGFDQIIPVLSGSVLVETDLDCLDTMKCQRKIVNLSSEVRGNVVTRVHWVEHFDTLIIRVVSDIYWLFDRLK